MSYRTIVIILALLIALMPFLGFPYGFEKYFYLIAGILIASFAYNTRRWTHSGTYAKRSHQEAEQKGSEQEPDTTSHNPGAQQ